MGSAEPPAATDQGLARALAEVNDVAEIQARACATKRVSRADCVTAWALGAGFVALAVGYATQAPLPSWRNAVLAAALVVVYGAARRTELIGPTGDTVPTQPVLVAFFFTVPVPLVPLLVLAGLLAGGSLRHGPDGLLHRLLVRAASGWHSAGAVTVVWLAGLHEPTLVRWPVLIGALFAQFAVDTVVAAVRCTALGARARTLVRPLRFTFSVDALLAPLALCTGVAVGASPALVVLAAAPVALLRVLAVDRNERYSTAVKLSQTLKSVEVEARSDPLSGLANRRAWAEAVAAAETVAAAEAAAPGGEDRFCAVVLMADLDYLKLVNDTFGHDAGDGLIRAFAQVLVDNVPPGAVVARLGGDEFGVLWTVRGDGRLAGEELRERVRQAVAAHQGPQGTILSASVGVAAYPPATSVTEALRLADAGVNCEKRSRSANRDTNRPLVIL